MPVYAVTPATWITDIAFCARVPSSCYPAFSVYTGKYTDHIRNEFLLANAQGYLKMTFS